jgi:hypothetical protein
MLSRRAPALLTHFPHLPALRQQSNQFVLGPHEDLLGWREWSLRLAINLPPIFASADRLKIDRSVLKKSQMGGRKEDDRRSLKGESLP